MNSYYLGLDLNLPQNIKILKVKKELGYSGFGLYVELLLKLAQTPDYELLKTDYELLAYEFRVETKYVQILIEDFDLFTLEKDKFYCSEVKAKMSNLEKKKEAGKVAGKASGEARKKNKTNGRSTVVQTVVEQGDIIKKGNIINKSKEINLPGLQADCKPLFLDYLEMRKQIKKQATEKAIELAISQLNKFSLEKQKEMLKSSILNNWSGIYEPKQQLNVNSTYSTQQSKAEQEDLGRNSSLEDFSGRFAKRKAYVWSVDFKSPELFTSYISGLESLDVEIVGMDFDYTQTKKPLPMAKPTFNQI